MRERPTPHETRSGSCPRLVPFGAIKPTDRADTGTGRTFAALGSWSPLRDAHNLQGHEALKGTWRIDDRTRSNIYATAQGLVAAWQDPGVIESPAPPTSTSPGSSTLVRGGLYRCKYPLSVRSHRDQQRL